MEAHKVSSVWAIKCSYKFAVKQSEAVGQGETPTAQASKNWAFPVLTQSYDTFTNLSAAPLALSKIKHQPPNIKWVSRPGPIAREHPGLKIETWATHLMFVRVIFIFLGGPQAHVSSGRNDTPRGHRLF